MISNVALDENLLMEAVEVGGLKSKDETINAALQEFIQRRQTDDIVSLFGQIDFDPGYDYKSERKGHE